MAYFKKFWSEVVLSKVDLGAVRNDVLAYIDEIDALQQQNERLNEALILAMSQNQDPKVYKAVTKLVKGGEST